MDKERSINPASSVTHSILDDILEGRETSPTPEQKREALSELLRRWREEDQEEPEESMDDLKIVHSTSKGENHVIFLTLADFLYSL
ncbi:MAG TPA: hypothetical protein DHW02_13605 [Ktedonobacter sp.]|nr:hypothetical protein [Ktedonobacter sp.]